MPDAGSTRQHPKGGAVTYFDQACHHLLRQCHRGRIPWLLRVDIDPASLMLGRMFQYLGGLWLAHKIGG